MSNEVKELKVYLGGDLLSVPMQDYRAKQRDEIDGIVGIKCYSPSDDKSINDKSNAVQEGLAERILRNDYNAMMECDVFTFDILNHATGTISELSILLGMKREAEKLLDYDLTPELLNYVEDILRKPVFIYSSDIREGNGHTYDDPYRTEVSFNQFLYGVILEITDGKGFMSWEEVLKRLEKLGDKNG